MKFLLIIFLSFSFITASDFDRRSIKDEMYKNPINEYSKLATLNEQLLFFDGLCNKAILPFFPKHINLKEFYKSEYSLKAIRRIYNDLKGNSEGRLIYAEFNELYGINLLNTSFKKLPNAYELADWFAVLRKVDTVYQNSLDALQGISNQKSEAICSSIVHIEIEKVLLKEEIIKTFIAGHEECLKSTVPFMDCDLWAKILIGYEGVIADLQNLKERYAQDECLAREATDKLNIQIEDFKRKMQKYNYESGSVN